MVNVCDQRPQSWGASKLDYATAELARLTALVLVAES